MSSVLATMFDRIRAVVSGGGLDGLSSAAVSLKLQQPPNDGGLSTARVLELRAVEIERHEEIVSENAEATAADLKEARARAVQEIDDGGPGEYQLPILDGRHITAFLRKWAALASEYGIVANPLSRDGGTPGAGAVGEAINERIAVLDRALELRYAIEGEPAEALELRRSVKTTTKNLVWPAAEKVRVTRRMYATCRSEESEQESLQAAAELDAAQHRVEALKRQLRRDYGVRVPW